jgi:5-methyltetrahydrofolate--homocysteine methyltransferase
MIELATEFVKVSRVPVIIEPNAGQPTPTKTGIEYPSDPESFSSEMVKIKYAGAKILGGCCGTTPEFIRVMKEKLG